jgi:hypothetical protein
MADENPYSAPARRVDRANEAAGDNLVQPLLEPLYGARVWMQIVAVVSIIGAVLMIIASLIGLNFIGMLMGAVVGWIAWTLNQATTNVTKAYRNGNQRQAKEAMKALAAYFRIIGIITLIYILLIGLAVAFGMSMLTSMMSRHH